VKTAYELGFEAGKNDFDIRGLSTPNPYAVLTQDHDDFERGWQDGYDEALENFI
jgi:hypothetical protein